MFSVLFVLVAVHVSEYRHVGCGCMCVCVCVRFYFSVIVHQKRCLQLVCVPQSQNWFPLRLDFTATVSDFLNEKDYTLESCGSIWRSLALNNMTHVMQKFA